MMSICQIIMLYTLNLYSVVCQLSLKSLEGKKVYFIPSIVLEGCGFEREEKNWKGKERSQLYWTDGTQVKKSNIKALFFLKFYDINYTWKQPRSINGGMAKDTVTSSNV